MDSIVKTRIPQWVMDCSHAEFISMIRGLPYPIFPKPRDEREQVPSFAEAFSNLCENLKRLPTQKEYADYYISESAHVIEALGRDIGKYRNRAYRNHPSFTRECQAYLLFKDEFTKSIICSSIELDKNGIDFEFTNKEGLKFGVASFARTKKALEHNERKDAGARASVPYEILKLSVDDKDCININGYWLYGDSHIKELKRLIRIHVLK